MNKYLTLLLMFVVISTSCFGATAYYNFDSNLGNEFNFSWFKCTDSSCDTYEPGWTQEGWDLYTDVVTSRSQGIGDTPNRYWAFFYIKNSSYVPVMKMINTYPGVSSPITYQVPFTQQQDCNSSILKLNVTLKSDPLTDITQALPTEQILVNMTAGPVHELRRFRD